MRITDHPVLGPAPAVAPVTFYWEGRPIPAIPGEPIAAALLAAGVRTLRHSELSGAARGWYCAIGHCQECRVTVDGVSGVRACLTPVRGGERVAP